jgi:hypothetical protein
VSAKRSEAAAAIRGILSGLSDRDLPKGRAEISDGRITLWFGGHGHILGTAKRGGKGEPDVIRSGAIAALFDAEAASRADRDLLGGDE